MKKKNILQLAVRVVAAITFFAASIPAYAIEDTALPTGGDIVAGSGSISQSGAAMTINQQTDKMITNWNTFDIGSQASVNFVQPNASSVSLNRVIGSDPSHIFGNLTANGSVFLLNPSGVIFGPTAYVDLGGLVATSLTLSDAAFLNSNFNFINAGGAGNILNQGTIQAPIVALIAPQVKNEGTIISPSGNVALVAGNQVSLDFAGDGLLNVNVQEAAVNALVENKNLIKADGGTVIMTAKAAGDLMATVVNNEGIIQAKGLSGKNGKIILDGGGTGITGNSGTLDVSSDNGTGGKIVMTGDKVLVDAGAKLNANGSNGGGKIYVGGGAEGNDPSIKNAKALFINSDSLITADALQLGNGGKIIVYSKDSSRVYGNLSVRGGAQEGNGGFVETSGGWFDIGMTPDISAANGNGGTWLIDPYNLSVVAGNAVSNIGTSSPFESSGDTASLGVDRVDTALASGNVIIRTGAGGSQAGDIIWDVDYTYAGATARSLTLQAHQNITLNQTIATSDGALTLVFTADSDSNGTGGVVVKENLTTRGGSVTFNGVGTIFSGAAAQAITTSGGTIDFNGEVLLANTNGITLTTAGGSVGFDTYLDSGNSYELVATNTNWTAARASASVTSGIGASAGDTYLATITSALELTAVLVATNGGTQAWLGGSDSSTEGTWRWVAGPEGLENSGLGRIFQTSTTGGLTGYSGYNGAFVNWNGGEPNNAGNEDALQMGAGLTAQWNDLPAGSGNLSSVKETNLAASPLTISAGAGNVTFSGAVGTNKALASLNVTANSVAINGGAVTTEGVQTYTAPITLGSSSTTLSQTNTNTDFTLATGRAITNATGSAASLAIKTTRNILMDSGSSISSGAGVLNVTLNSDSDATSSGQIQMNGSSISSNGGSITLGGGSNAGTYSYGSTNSGSLDRGVVISNSSLTAAGGNIVIRGQGLNGAATPIGTDITLNSTISTTGSGNISISGLGGTGSSGVTTGINLWNSAGLTGATIRTQNGTIDLIGTSGSGTDRNHGIGYDVARSYIFSTGGGAITLTGTGDVGISRTTTGSLYLGWDGTTTYASNLTLNANTVDLTNLDARSTGSLTVRPTSAGTTIGIAGGSGTLALPAALFSTNFANGFSGITVGKSDASTITLGGATTFNDNITLLSTDGINLDAAVNATGQQVTLTAGSGDTVSGSGNITATSLLLNGTGSINTLDTATTNSVGTIASTGVASVNFKNSGSLAVGTVSGTNGVTATGAIRLEANGATADLTLDRAVTTTSGVINLAAGRNFINNNASNTGIVPGSGRYLVYSSNPTDTTEAMTGYSKHYNQTYNSGSNPGYAGSGNWFLYTIAPTLSISVADQTITYGDVASTYSPSYSGFIDGDSSSDLSGTGTFSTSGSTSTAGFVTAGTHNVSYVNGLTSTNGYTLSDDTSRTSELTVNKLALSVSGISALNKIYDGNANATLSGSAATGSVISGDIVTVAGLGTGTFNSVAVGTGKPVTITGTTLGGADGANYAPIAPTGVTADITPVIIDTSSITTVATGTTGTSETSNSIPAKATTIQPGNGATALSVEGTPLVTDHTGSATGGMSLSTDNSTNSISFSSSGNTMTLNLGGQSATPEVQTTIPVFSGQDNQVKSEGSFKLVDSGNRVSLTPQGNNAISAPDMTGAGPIESFSVKMSDGTMAEFTVSVTPKGVLIIKAIKSTENLDSQSVTLTGLAVAKQKLNLSSGKVTAVVILR